MITRMEVTSAMPGAPPIPLGGFQPNTEVVQIRDISGLGPVKAQTSSTPFATGRGELFQGASTGSRNIVLTLGLSPNWVDQTIMSLRHLLYRYFLPENWVTLRFFSDELPSVYLMGVVESFEPNIFSEDPEMQISIIAPKPDFIAVDATVIRGQTGTDENAVEYEGTAPTGFELHIQSSTDLESYNGDIEISNQVGPLAQDMIVRSVNIDVGLYFKMATVRSIRELESVSVAFGAVNILSKMDPRSTWPEFNPGENLLKVITSTPGLDWVLGYFNRFGGL